MKQFKKLLTGILLSCTCLLSLCACKDGSKMQKAEEPQTQSSVPQKSTREEPDRPDPVCPDCPECPDQTDDGKTDIHRDPNYPDDETPGIPEKPDFPERVAVPYPMFPLPPFRHIPFSGELIGCFPIGQAVVYVKIVYDQPEAEEIPDESIPESLNP